MKIGLVDRGKIAAMAAGAGVGSAALVLVQAAVVAATGAHLVVLAPLLGVAIALAVYRALHQLCSSGSRRAEANAIAGIWFLIAVAIGGVSFGGFPLLLPALFLALAAALTPRPVRARRER